MTMHLAYATTGREFEVEEALTERGFEVWCGKRVEFLRRGKKRRAEAVTTPKLPNYLFISLTGQEWHDLRSRPTKYLAPTMYTLTEQDMRGPKGFERFRELTDESYQRGLGVAERNNAAEMVQFKEGEALIDLKGRFGEQAMKFRRIVERANDFPLIEAEAEMMGRTVTVRLDPLDVRATDAA